MKILKKIKLFLIKQRFKRNIQKKDNGLGYLDRIIIFEEQRPGHWFFSRSPFRRKLSHTLGKQINLEKIQHYILENRLGKKKIYICLGVCRQALGIFHAGRFQKDLPDN